MGDRGSKKAYTGPRTGIYLPTKFGCDRSIVVGCRSRNDRQTDKQNGMTIRLTLCDVNVTQYYYYADEYRDKYNKNLKVKSISVVERVNNGSNELR